MRCRAVVVLFAPLWACQGAEPADSSAESSGGAAVVYPPCAARSGEYRVRMIETDGNCGPVDDLLEQFDGQGQSTLCEGQQTISTDRCEVATALTCPSPVAGYRVQIDGRVTWDTEGASASGRGVKLYLLNKAGERECEGLYNVFYERRLDKGERCGVNCEPYSSRPCAGGQVEVCAPGGTAWGVCGAKDWRPSPVSICGPGLSCLPGGDGGGVRCQ